MELPAATKPTNANFVRVIRKNVQWIKVVTNDSIGTCSSELYSFNLLKLPPPPRAAICYIMYISKNRYGKHAYWNVLSFVSMRWRCPGIVYDQMLYRSKTYSTDPCNIPRTLAPTCLFMVRESFHKLYFGIFDGMLTRGLLKFSSSWTIQVPRTWEMMNFQLCSLRQWFQSSSWV